MSNIVNRKKDHLRIALDPAAQIGDAGFRNYRFTHNALPEINFDTIDTSTTFLTKKVACPFFISCMTGGVAAAEKLNQNLATAAQKYNIPMGVGSQRAAIENPDLRKLFQVRKYAPTVPIIANVGLVQLNYGFGLSQFKQIIDMVDAEALAVHVNAVQEVIQPEGDRNFADLLPKLEKIVPKLDVPIIVKEVGFGLSFDVVSRLYNIGIRVFDTAGWGGTNWAWVEGERVRDREGDKHSVSDTSRLGELFSQWGIPTTESIKQVNQLKSSIKSKKIGDMISILGSGGVRSGIDIAKCLALGADLAGLAAPFAKAALISAEEVSRLIDKLGYELRVAMLGVGAKNIAELKSTKLVEI